MHIDLLPGLTAIRFGRKTGRFDRSAVWLDEKNLTRATSSLNFVT